MRGGGKRRIPGGRECPPPQPRGIFRHFSGRPILPTTAVRLYCVFVNAKCGPWGSSLCSIDTSFPTRLNPQLIVMSDELAIRWDPMKRALLRFRNHSPQTCTGLRLFDVKLCVRILESWGSSWNLIKIETCLGIFQNIFRPLNVGRGQSSMAGKHGEEKDGLQSAVFCARCSVGLWAPRGASNGYRDLGIELGMGGAHPRVLSPCQFPRPMGRPQTRTGAHGPRFGSEDGGA